MIGYDESEQLDVEPEAHPEFANGGRAFAGEASNGRNTHSQAGRAGEEVLRHKTKQLDQVAERGFAAISLPSGGRREADRRMSWTSSSSGRRPAREPTLDRGKDNPPVLTALKSGKDRVYTPADVSPPRWTPITRVTKSRTPL